MSELFKFAYHIAGDLSCYQCEEPFEYATLKFEPSDNLYDLRASYQCESCSTDYVLLVEELPHMVTVEAYRADQTPADEDDHPVTSSSSHKAGLHEELHPARDLVEGSVELINARQTLEVNKQRIQNVVEELDQQGLRPTRGFRRRVKADLHNYLASAYSFDQIRSTVESELPTDGPVESLLDNFEQHQRVIAGLRTYAQHYLTLPVNYSNYVHPKTGEERLSITVKVEDINEIESDKDRYPPDGYAAKGGAEYHYGHIDIDFIDIELHVQSHYQAADDLVSGIISHSQDVHGDDLEEYLQKTDFKRYYDSP